MDALLKENMDIALKVAKKSWCMYRRLKLDPDDLNAEAMLALSRAYRAYDGRLGSNGEPVKLQTLVYRSAVHALNNYCKKALRHSRHYFPCRYHRDGTSEISELESRENGPNVEAREVWSRAMRLSRCLTPRQRQVFRMLYRDQLTCEEAARQLGCSRQNVEASRRKILATLRGKLRVEVAA